MIHRGSIDLAKARLFVQRISLLGCLFLCVPLGLAAQASSAKVEIWGYKQGLTPDERAGEGLFLTNCAFCHFPHKAESPEQMNSPANDNKNPSEKPLIGPSLRGLFKGKTPLPESSVRSFIMQGFPGEMPAFRYGLDQKQIDSIISYLKAL